MAEKCIVEKTAEEFMEDKRFLEEERQMETLGACILAAGFSSRMGAFKPLLPLGDRTVIERAITVFRAAGVKTIVVVTGYNREALLPVLEREAVTEAFNPHFEEGMFTSIQTGTAAMPRGLDGFFLMPVDCPLITESVLDVLKQGFEPDRFAVPCYRGKKGHPLLIPASYWEEILQYHGRGGLKSITDREFEKMKRIPVNMEGVVMDMDTPQAYEEIRDYLKRGCESESLEKAARGRRFFLVRHGQIHQHREKIFLGQTDVPLSLEGEEQAKAAGDRLAEFALHTNRIYSSDLMRASQTAKIMQERMGLDRLILDRGLREMNLGLWDGKFISEIKQQFPQEYEKRGENLMAYKLGPGSENFYDLQYRAVKKLIHILKKDNCQDVILVAHSGVLRALNNNLYGGDVSDEWEPVGTGKVRIIQK